MAKLSYTFTVISAAVLIFLFTSAYARPPLDQPEHTVTATASVDQLPDSKSKTTTTTLILPSEKPETEPATFVELEPEETETVDSSSKLSSKDSLKEKTEADSVPLTVITFRPINRQFARRPLFPFRRGHKCHGRRHRQFNQLSQGQRSYGNDMIVSGEENLGLNRQNPTRLTRFKNGGHRFAFVNEAKRDEINNGPRYLHHHHHGHKEHDHYYNGGFMKGIRKFLHNF